MLRRLGSREAARLVGLRQPQTRANWIGVVEPKFDRISGTYKHESWDEKIRQCTEPNKGGYSLLDRHEERIEYGHIKPKMRRRMIQDRQLFDRQEKRIDNLTRYIKFMKEKDPEFSVMAKKKK